MIQAVFFDIDGTLIDTSTHTIPASTIKAIKQLKKNGMKVAIASGRDMKNILDISFLDPSLFDGFVASNGMCIFDHNVSCISKHPYPSETIQKVFDYANQHEITLVFETMNDIYLANKINDYVDISNDYYHESTPHAKTWDTTEEVVKVTCFQEQNFDFSELLSQCSLNVLSTPTTTYDLTLPSVSKLTGIHEIMKYWNLDIHSFMCFGDHENDIEMIEGAQLGVAVKDALGSPHLQEIADATCDAASNDGIYHFLKENRYI